MLVSEELRRAARAVEAWRLGDHAACRCPRCDAPDLAVVDQSARPYSEWYHLTCRACGLDANLNIPLGGAPGGE